MSEKRNIRRTRNLTNGSMALNVRNTAVPKRRYVPEEQPEKLPKKLPRNKVEYTKYADLRFAPSIDKISFVCLMITAVMLVVAGVGYLRVRSEIKQTEDYINVATIELINLKTANDNTENTLYSNIDLEKIRETAIKKYGMVYPYENQVIKYKSVTDGYVRQYGNLKGNEELSIVERILRLMDAR